MTIEQPLMSCIQASTLALVPRDWVPIFSDAKVRLSDESNSRFSYQASWIDDCWLALCHGRGHVKAEAAPGQEPPTDHVILALPLSGTNRFYGMNFSERAGDVSLRPWAKNYAVTSTGDFSYLVVHIPRHKFANFGVEELPLEGSISTFSGLGRVIALNLKAFATETFTPSQSGSLSSIFASVLHLVISAFESKDESLAERSLRDKRAKVREYVELNLSNAGLSGELVARECGLSKRQLYRAFAEGGQSFAEMVRQTRLECAAREMASTGSLSDIARRCGFSSSSSFSHAFKDHFGLSPSEFRNI